MLYKNIQTQIPIFDPSANELKKDHTKNVVETLGATRLKPDNSFEFSNQKLFLNNFCWHM